MSAWQLRAGYIGRVVRCGTEHVCGICRTRYADRMDAEACIENCWENFIGLEPVLSRGAADIFCCRYCARRYKYYDDAMDCAEKCRAHAVIKHTRERQILRELAVMPPPRRTFKPKAPAVQPTPQLHFAPVKPTTQPTQEFRDPQIDLESGPEADAEPPIDLPSPTTPIAERLSDWADVDSGVESTDQLNDL